MTDAPAAAAPLTAPTHLRILPERYGVYRLNAMPTLFAASLLSLTVTEDEISLVCPEEERPSAELITAAETGWRAMHVCGTLDFAATGILASLSAPLAEAAISLFALSTFDTDYLLVKEPSLSAACTALKQAGWEIVQDERRMRS
jgi:hypothetical protein